jgi:hypothetical protein
MSIIAMDRSAVFIVATMFRLSGTPKRSDRPGKSHPGAFVFHFASGNHTLAGFDQRDQLAKDLGHIGAVDLVYEQGELLGRVGMGLFTQRQKRTLLKDTVTPAPS